MSQSKFSTKEIVERGEEIYQQKIRKHVESEHHGEFLVLDILTGEYEIAEVDLTATKCMLSSPEGVFYGLRIGHRAAYRLRAVSKV